LAEKRGAKTVLALDNDPWCVENTLENLEMNHCQKISAQLSSSFPKKNKYDMVLANINTNLLLKQIKGYSQVLVPGGDVIDEWLLC
jgi:ribosomal protein L11 methyltransferase